MGRALIWLALAVVATGVALGGGVALAATAACGGDGCLGPDALEGAVADAPGPTPQSLQAASAPSTGNSPWVVLPCRFPGNASEQITRGYLQDLFTHPKGLINYFKEESYGRLRVSAQVQDWKSMARSPATSDPDDLFRACTAAHNDDVNFSSSHSVAMVFNQQIGANYGGTTSAEFTLDGNTRNWPYAMISSGDKTEALWAHEMSHAYGLPHGGGGPGGEEETFTWWDPMSFPCGIYFHEAGPPFDPAYGCIPNHTRAFYKDNLLGWIPAARRYTAKAGTQTINIERLAQPRANANYLIARIPIRGTQQFFTLEARTRTGFDGTQLKDGIIINRTYGSFFDPRPFEVVTVGETTTDSFGQTVLDYEDALLEAGEGYTNSQFGYSVKVNSRTAASFNVTIAVQSTCNGLRTTRVGTPGADEIEGTGGADVIAGLGGDDRITGLGGDDRLCGNGGKDLLHGQDGNDQLNAVDGAGGDLANGGPGADDSCRIDAGDTRRSCER